MDKLSIKLATKNDLKFIDSLQKKNSQELSFYPKVTLEREIDLRRIVMAIVNNDHAGYLYFGAINYGKPVKIHQACIEYDLRGNWYGTGLIQYLEKYVFISQADGISLRCRSNILANNFWKLSGFECISVTSGGKMRNADINTWYKKINNDLFGMQILNTLTPSEKQIDTSEYLKNYKKKDRNKIKKGVSPLLSFTC